MQRREINKSNQNARVIETGTKTILFSYQTLVAYYDKKDGNLYRTSKRWSNTTSKHISNFIRELNGTPFATYEKDQNHFDTLLESI